MLLGCFSGVFCLCAWFFACPSGYSLFSFCFLGISLAALSGFCFLRPVGCCVLFSSVVFLVPLFWTRFLTYMLLFFNVSAPLSNCFCTSILLLASLGLQTISLHCSSGAWGLFWASWGTFALIRYRICTPGGMLLRATWVIPKSWTRESGLSGSRPEQHNLTFRLYFPGFRMIPEHIRGLRNRSVASPNTIPRLSST